MVDKIPSSGDIVRIRQGTGHKYEGYVGQVISTWGFGEEFGKRCKNLNQIVGVSSLYPGDGKGYENILDRLVAIELSKLEFVERYQLPHHGNGAVRKEFDKLSDEDQAELKPFMQVFLDEDHKMRDSCQK